MGSFFQSLLFVVVLVGCTSNIHVVAINSEDFDCDADISIPPVFDKLCSGHGMGNKINDYVATQVDKVFAEIHGNCNDHVDKICDGLPEQVKKYSAGGVELCKEDLKEVLCKKPLSRQEGHGKQLHCSFLKGGQPGIYFPNQKKNGTIGCVLVVI